MKLRWSMIKECAHKSDDAFESCHEKTCFIQYTNKGADQPAHPRSLISGFVVRCLGSIIPVLSKSKISIL